MLICVSNKKYQKQKRANAKPSYCVEIDVLHLGVCKGFSEFVPLRILHHCISDCGHCNDEAEQGSAARRYGTVDGRSNAVKKVRKLVGWDETMHEESSEGNNERYRCCIKQEKLFHSPFQESVHDRILAACMMSFFSAA